MEHAEVHARVLGERAHRQARRAALRVELASALEERVLDIAAGTCHPTIISRSTNNLKPERATFLRQHCASSNQENNMRYLPLGRTGLFVSELCLGTMTFGGSGESMWAKIGELQQSEAERLVGQAIDAGI